MISSSLIGKRKRPDGSITNSIKVWPSVQADHRGRWTWPSVNRTSWKAAELIFLTVTGCAP
jgi:hypothetical protein